MIQKLLPFLLAFTSGALFFCTIWASVADLSGWWQLNFLIGSLVAGYLSIMELLS